MCDSLSHGGEKNRKNRNIIITNDIITVKKNTDTKDIHYLVKFNKINFKDEMISNSLIVLQDVLQNILYSINSDLSFSSFYSLEEYLKKK